MTTFAKAYTLLRDAEQRKKADIISRAHNFATEAAYYRYRDEMDFRELVAAKHPLVVEAYPELFSEDEPSEPETEEIQPTEGARYPLKHSGPLAWEKVLYPNSALPDELDSNPETNDLRDHPDELASDHEPATEQNGEEETLSLWARLRPLLLSVVGAQNFEVYLSSVRQGPVFGELIIFQVPNTYFQEYLSERYGALVKDLLVSLGECRTFLFQAPAEEDVLPPTKAPTPIRELTPKAPLAKWEQRLEDLANAREQCTVFDPIYGKHILRIKEHAMLLDVLKLKWAAEDAPAPVPPIKRE